MQTTNRKIRVLVVDDSAVARSVIIQGLSASPRIEVVGYAVNAMDAKTKLQHLSPDVMTLDVEMPGINGIDFLKQFLPSHPLPVILVSSLNLRVFDALAAGAVDFVRKPDAVESRESFLQALTHKIIVASHARLSRANLPHPAAPAAPLRFGGDGAPEQTVIGLGASTGGTEATLNVLRRLPANIPGMVIWQDSLNSAASQLSGSNDQASGGMSVSSLTSLLNGSSQSLTASSMNNAAGILSYCAKQKLASVTSADNVKNQVLDKLGLSTPEKQKQDTSYLDGLQGLLNSKNGQQLDLNTLGNSSLAKQVKIKACDLVLKQGVNFLS